MKYQIANYKDGRICASARDLEQAQRLAFLYKASIFVIPEDQRKNFKIGDILPSGILKSCEYETLLNDLGYIP